MQMKRRPSNQQALEDKVIQLKFSFTHGYLKYLISSQREVRSTSCKESSSNLPLVCSLARCIFCPTFSSLLPPPPQPALFDILSKNEDLHGIYGGDEFAM